MSVKLFVGNLPFNTTPAELESLFGQVGAVASVNIITDKFTGRSRGFGFVEMSNNDEAQNAIERFNGHEMQGRALTVNEAKPQEPRSGVPEHIESRSGRVRSGARSCGDDVRRR